MAKKRAFVLLILSGISIQAPDSTFYLFPNRTAIMERKEFTDVKQLMTEALTNTNVSFCTRNHFGRATENRKNHYIRFAYSGIEVEDIEKGMLKLKTNFET